MINFIVVIHMQHASSNGGTTCEFEMARRISQYGYETKVYYPFENGSVVSGIYDKFATLEDVNDDTVAIYCAHRLDSDLNPLKAKRVVRWVALGVQKELYNKFNDSDIIYYHAPFCKNNITSQRLFSCYLSPEIKNRYEQRTIDICYVIKKGIIMSKNFQRKEKNQFPHNFFSTGPISFLRRNPLIIDLDGYNLTLENSISYFNKSKYFFCYDPACFLVIVALLCGCIVVQDPIDGYTEEEWMYSLGIPKKLNGLAYGLQNIKWAKATISESYGPCMEYVAQSDISIKKFLHEMETGTYNTKPCYKYEETYAPMTIKFLDVTIGI